jgi:hypothetical protein
VFFFFSSPLLQPPTKNSKITLRLPLRSSLSVRIVHHHCCPKHNNNISTAKLKKDGKASKEGTSPNKEEADVGEAI